jgi:hypothetical protein
VGVMAGGTWYVPLPVNSAASPGEGFRSRAVATAKATPTSWPRRLARAGCRFMSSLREPRGNCNPTASVAAKKSRGRDL